MAINTKTDLAKNVRLPVQRLLEIGLALSNLRIARRLDDHAATGQYCFTALAANKLIKAPNFGALDGKLRYVCIVTLMAISERVMLDSRSCDAK